MTLTFRSLFFIVLTILLVWFFYLEREILTPFVLAAIVAYLLNPVVNFLTHKVRLPRTLSIISIYAVIIVGLAFIGGWLVTRIIDESEELARLLKEFLSLVRSEIAGLPPWLQDFVSEPIKSLQTSITKPQFFLPFFSGALSGFFQTLIFLFATFYLLKEGGKTLERLTLFLSGDYRVEAQVLLRKMNSVLNKYLRGQLLLVLIMATISFIGLSILGVKFSLLLALLIGLAEIVPVFGPIVAGTVASFFAIFDGVSRFGIEPIYEGLLVLLGYFTLNQIENYLIVPHIMGKITRIHPLIILFSVLAGGHLFGILGLILAVPIVAALRILLEYSLDKLAKK